MNKGGVLLPTILMIAVIVMIVGIAGLLIGVVLNRSNASIRASNMAYAGAEAAIQDVRQRIIRNTTWLPTCASFAEPTYSMTLGGGVTVDVCVQKTGNQYIAQALGKTRLQKRRLDAVIEVDAATGQVRLKSFNEVQF